MNPRINAVLVAFALLVTGCKHGYGETDLNIALSKHHSNLRWGRIENAALVVDPELRLAFTTEWTQRMRDIELQDVDVAGLSMSDDGNSCDVLVGITYVERNTMSVRQVQLQERWERTTEGWIAKRPATLDLSPPAAPSP